MSITQPIYGGKRKQKRRRKCMLLPRHRQNLFLVTLHKISAPFLCNPPNFQNKRCTFAIFGSICMKAFFKAAIQQKSNPFAFYNKPVNRM